MCSCILVRSDIGLYPINEDNLSTTTQRRSRLQHGYCIGVSRQGAQVTASEGLAQGPYVASRAGVEPTTIRLKVIDSTKVHSFIQGFI